MKTARAIIVLLCTLATRYTVKADELPKRITATDDSAETKISWFSLEMYKAPSKISNESLDRMKNITTDVLNQEFIKLFYNFKSFDLSVESVEIISREITSVQKRGKGRSLRNHNRNAMSRDLQDETEPDIDSGPGTESGISITLSGTSTFFIQPVQSQNKIDKNIIESLNKKKVNNGLIEMFTVSDDIALADIYDVSAVEFVSNAPSLAPSNVPTASPEVAASSLPSAFTSKPSYKMASTFPSMLLSIGPSSSPTTLHSFSPTTSDFANKFLLDQIVDEDDAESTTIIWSGLILGAAFVVIFGLFIRKRKNDLDDEFTEDPNLSPKELGAKHTFPVYMPDIKDDFWDSTSPDESHQPNYDILKRYGTESATMIYNDADHLQDTPIRDNRQDAISPISDEQKEDAYRTIHQISNTLNVKSAATASGFFLQPETKDTENSRYHSDYVEDLDEKVLLTRRLQRESESSTFDDSHGSSGEQLDKCDGAFPCFGPSNDYLKPYKVISALEPSTGKNNMHPLDWSNKSEFDAISSASSITGNTEEEKEGRVVWEKYNRDGKNVKSHDGISSFTNGSLSTATSKDSKQLINDLVWLEKRISEVRGATSPETIVTNNESVMSPIMQNIFCRDCFAPPGKLNIIIQSTKDGPCVHSVYENSALAGQLFPGDLIIAVDNVDTRSMLADQVMKIMQAKNSSQRKITVLHFEE